jgi:hypothetical protein
VLGVSEDGLILYRLEALREDDGNTGPHLVVIGPDGVTRATMSCDWDGPCGSNWLVEEEPLPKHARKALHRIGPAQSLSDLSVKVARALGTTRLNAASMPIRVRLNHGPCFSVDAVAEEGMLPLYQIYDYGGGEGCARPRVALFEHPHSDFVFLRIQYDDGRTGVDDDRWISKSHLEGWRLVRNAERAYRQGDPDMAVRRSRLAMELVPESYEARVVLAHAMADAGYAWSAAMGDLDVPYPQYHDCTLWEHGASLETWLREQSPWKDDPWLEKWISSVSNRHHAAHRTPRPWDLINPSAPRPPRKEMMEEMLAEENAGPASECPDTAPAPAEEPSASESIPAEPVALPQSEPLRLRIVVRGLPIAFDLGSLIVLCVHVFILAGILVAMKRRRTQPS